jgi:GNAT superfamily N-acetyltransferase
MELCLLADHPTAIPKIASWYFDEWGYTKPGRSVAGIAADLKAYLNRHKVPLIVVAIEERVVIGAAQLKFREMDIYPDRVHWLGGVFVDPKYRANGLGSKLINKIAEIGRTLEVRTLYLQTVRLDGGLYARLGWQPLDRVRSSVGDVVVMERHL